MSNLQVYKYTHINCILPSLKKQASGGYDVISKISVPSAQFCCKPKTVLKNKVDLRKKHHPYIAFSFNTEKLYHYKDIKNTWAPHWNKNQWH